MAPLLIATRARLCFADRALILSSGWICCRVSLIYHNYGTSSSGGGISRTPLPSRRSGFDDDLHLVRRSPRLKLARQPLRGSGSVIGPHPFASALGGKRRSWPVTTGSACCRALSGAHPRTLTRRPGSLSGAASPQQSDAPLTREPPQWSRSSPGKRPQKNKVVAIWMIITVVFFGCLCLIAV
jgi:hypothetical protein